MVANFVRSNGLMAVATKDSQINTLRTFRDQVALQKTNISSNQSEDIRAIRNSMSEEVQLLKNMTQGFAKTSTQASFAALAVFLLGMTLVIYGLRLTVRTMGKEISIYFKIMMWGLIAPVIAIIVIYQLGILTRTRLEFVNTNEPFFFISILLLVPVGIVVFLLIAERRVLAGFHKKP
jgi:hypothetical protein